MSHTNYQRNYNAVENGITLYQLENVLQNARPIYINQLIPCLRLSQHNEVPIKKRDKQEILNSLLLSSTKKTIDPHKKVDDEEWHVLTLSNNTIIDVPDFINDIFKSINLDGNMFYTTLFDNVNGFWYCILAGLDSSFIGRTKQNQIKYILEFKQNLMDELDKYFEPLHYRGYGFARSTMYSLLQQFDVYNPCLGHYTSDFLKLNIAMINEKKELFWVAPYKEDRVTLLLWKQGIKWGVIVHPDNRSHLLPNAKELLEGICTKGNLIEWDKNSHVESDPLVLKNIKKDLKNLKIKELVDKALLLEIDIVNQENGKKKVKEQLIKEIFKALSGQEF